MLLGRTMHADQMVPDRNAPFSDSWWKSYTNKETYLIRDLCDLQSLERRIRPTLMRIDSELVVQFLLEDQASLRLLAQMSNPCVRIRTDTVEGIGSEFRKKFHRAGFYEILRYSNCNSEYKLNDSSIEVIPTGELHIESNDAGIVSTTSVDQVFFASRYPCYSQLAWNWVYGSALWKQSTPGSPHSGNVVASPFGAMLAIHQNNQLAPFKPHRVTATFEWSKNDSTAGNASIVGSYSGPGDSSMLLAMIEPIHENQAVATLWRCVDKWEPMIQVNISGVSGSQAEESLVQAADISLEIDHETVSVYFSGEKIMELSETQVPRRLSSGIRILGQRVAIKGLSQQAVGSYEH